jgi:hypothetical protein
MLSAVLAIPRPTPCALSRLSMTCGWWGIPSATRAPGMNCLLAHVTIATLQSGVAASAARSPNPVAAAFPQGDLVVLLPTEGVKLVPEQSRRRVAHSHRDFPLLDQLLWPGVSGIKPGGLSIPIWSFPLRPICGKERPYTGQHQADGQQAYLEEPVCEIPGSDLDSGRVYPVTMKAVPKAIKNTRNGMAGARRRRLPAEPSTGLSLHPCFTGDRLRVRRTGKRRWDCRVTGPTIHRIGLRRGAFVCPSESAGLCFALNSLARCGLVLSNARRVTAARPEALRAPALVGSFVSTQSSPRH